ncbi:PAS domain S-box protein [Vogesella oryzae]|uniref:PAS domain S-box protein n=1 Tax=Vogesella oryzae TaxID=1735285 RepID=UPI001582E0CB|nr:PAS domain S-box protein [Vogesella oryzae]
MTPPFACDPLLHALLEKAPIGIAVLDDSLRYLHINQLLADSNGHSIASHIGRSPRDVLPDVGEQLEAIMRDVIASGEARCNFEAQAEVPPGSGQFRLWNASYHPYRQDNQILGIIAMVEDVTHARDTARRLRNSEQHIRRVLDNLFTFVGVLSPDGTMLEVNRAPLEAAGIALDSVRGQKMWDTFWWSASPENQALAQQLVSQAASGETVRREVTVKMQDGPMTIDLMLAPLRDDNGDITHLIGSANDVSARTRSEQALRQSETHFRQVVEATPDALMMVDDSGVIRLVNGRMEELFGYSRDELIGKGFDHLLPPSVRNQHQSLVRHFFAHPSTRDMANRKPLFAMRRDGSSFPCEIGLNPLEIDGQLLTLASITNVTARYQAQQAMEKALDEKTVLLGEVHHRVKNNLQVISSLLNLQARNAAEPVRVALVESQNHVKSMALIHQLLYERSDFSRVPLTTYLERLLMLLQHSLANNRLKVSVHFTPPPQEVFLELQQSIPLGLLVNEIVTNVFKHAFAGRGHGTLRLQLQPGEPDNRLSISDDGVGLPAGVALGESPTLGFQLLPMLAEQLQGRLELASQPQQGTHFVVHFPALATGETA